MTTMGQTVLDVVNHLLVKHPELAPAVEEIAARAQGRSLEDIRNFQEWKRGEGMDLQGLFSSIYEEGKWGQSGQPGDKYFSGSGSHDPEIVDVYVQAIRNFASGFDKPLDALDLGCGDFNVGSKIRPYFARYTACDIVPAVIEANREKYAGLDVEFKSLDLTTDPLPSADVILIRQVLQHLSNKDIANFLASVAGKCRYLVVTEHVPVNDDFEPNLNKPAGIFIRITIGSGVVLTAPPFNLKVSDARELCRVPEGHGVIITTAYTIG